MEELTIEQKAQRYDEALKQIKECTSDENGFITIYPQEIFPELRESEDERIRKGLIGYFRAGKCENISSYHGISTNDILSWLEKQGKKERDSRYKYLEKLLEADTIYQMAMNDAMVEEAKTKAIEAISNMEISKLLGFEKQGGQKPTEDVDLPEFESYLCLMFQKFRAKGMCTNGEIIDYVKEHSQKLRDILVNLAWSEEDERMYRGLHNLIYSTPYCDSRQEFSEWFKSLKDRVLPQPKQEWSEEDKKMLDFAIRAVGLCKQYAINHQVNGYSKLPDAPKMYEELQDWLKSLKNRVPWKPSEEQIKALEHAINCYSGISPINIEEVYALEIMKDQLKKLREE